MKKIFYLSLLLIPILIFAQSDSKKKAYYFYGEQCSHCQKVDEYFKANGIYEKYDITKMEFSNPFNGRLLLKFGEAFKDPNKGGVPAIAFADKFIVGDQPIIENFAREIDAADASLLPDPEKITTNAATENSAGTNNPVSSGTKNNYFSWIVVALIVAVGGALVYVNRNKSNK